MKADVEVYDPVPSSSKKKKKNRRKKKTLRTENPALQPLHSDNSIKLFTYVAPENKNDRSIK